MNVPQTTGANRIQRQRSCALCAAALAAALITFAAGAQIPCGYEVQVLPAPPPCQFWDRYISPTGISPNGRWVCGTIDDCGFDGYTIGVVLDTQSMQLHYIPRPPGVLGAWCNDVNDAAVAVGGCWRTGTGMRGWLYQLPNGPWTELGPVNPNNSQGWCSVEAINSQNVVCGTRSIGSQNDPENPKTAFKWSAGAGYEDLGLINGYSTEAADLNDSNAVTGIMNVNGTAHPFLWEGVSLIDLGTLLGLLTIPHELNESNQVVGQSATVAPWLQPHGFVWANSSMSDLGLLPGCVASRALAIGANGVIAGDCRDSTGNWYAVAWLNSSIVELNTFLAPNAGFWLNWATAVDARGSITATGTVAPGGIGIACLLRPVAGPTADVTNDCRVNVSDLLLVINEWHRIKSPADINGDGVVDALDLYEVIRQWTPN